MQNIYFVYQCLRLDIVTPAKRGRGRKRRQPTGENWLDKTPAERHVAMTWMQRLKRYSGHCIGRAPCDRDLPLSANYGHTFR
jgi:hypothetical protein